MYFCTCIRKLGTANLAHPAPCATKNIGKTNGILTLLLTITTYLVGLVANLNDIRLCQFIIRVLESVNDVYISAICKLILCWRVTVREGRECSSSVGVAVTSNQWIHTPTNLLINTPIPYIQRRPEEDSKIKYNAKRSRCLPHKRIDGTQPWNT